MGRGDGRKKTRTTQKRKAPRRVPGRDVRSPGLLGRGGGLRGALGVDGLGGERHAVARAEDQHEGADGAAGEHEADEKQDGAEGLVELQVHEPEDDHEELHDREEHERGDDEPLREREVDEHDLHAGDDGEDHGDLHEEVELAVVVVGVVLGGGGVGGGGHEGFTI